MPEPYRTKLLQCDVIFPAGGLIAQVDSLIIKLLVGAIRRLNAHYTGAFKKRFERKLLWTLKPSRHSLTSHLPNIERKMMSLYSLAFLSYYTRSGL